MPLPYCSGHAPKAEDIHSALLSAADLEGRRLGGVGTRVGMEAIADLLAELVSNGSLVGLVQGPAELGLRALGNRSILADPRSHETRDRLNRSIKHREIFRPLAPMLTLEAALDLFELPEGVSAGHYDALSYMGVTVKSKPGARAVIPAALHQDGTARVQVIHEDRNPFGYAYLKALGRRTGVEVSINTSLNIRSPIAATVVQAIDTLRRAQNLDLLLLIDDAGQAWAIGHAARSQRPQALDSATAIVRSWELRKRQPTNAAA
jgi:carbamoyltransferase